VAWKGVPSPLLWCNKPKLIEMLEVRRRANADNKSNDQREVED